MRSALVLFVAVAAAVGCAQSKKGDATVLAGPPTVTPSAPIVEIGSPPPPAHYTASPTTQCDVFFIPEAPKVDILWMIDSAGSMATRQADVSSNLQTVVTGLLGSQPPIDFHLAVITADADDPNESGRLHTWSNAMRPDGGNYVACDMDHVCNTALAAGGCGATGASCSAASDCCPGYQCTPAGDCDGSQSVIDAFQQLFNVGTSGSPVRRGLFATYQALSNPANQDRGNGGFIRPDASLYIVMVSDEDDESCTPEVGIPQSMTDYCRVDPSCHCDDNPTIGAATYWAKYFATYKGFGNEGLVSVNAIVAPNDGPVGSTFGDNRYFPGTTNFAHAGCTNVKQGKPAYWGKRYLDVAALTGGTAVSICDSSFADALGELSFGTPLRRSFLLSQIPDPSTLEAYIAPSPTSCGYRLCSTSSDCEAPDCNGSEAYSTCSTGRCAQSVPVANSQSSTTGEYVGCEGNVELNRFTFGSAVTPPRGSSVEICYAVASNSNATSCP